MHMPEDIRKVLISKVFFCYIGDREERSAKKANL
jgi:hypothetical protein